MPRIPLLLKDWHMRYEPYINAEKAISALPPAQPERRTGTWMIEKVYEDEYGNEEFGYFCSECGAQAYEFYQPYCHKCGAKNVKQRNYNEESTKRTD